MEANPFGPASLRSRLELMADHVWIVRAAVQSGEDEVEVRAICLAQLQTALFVLAGAVAAENVDRDIIELDRATTRLGLRRSEPDLLSAAHQLLPNGQAACVEVD